MKKSSSLITFLFCLVLIASCNRSDRNNDHESASVLDNLVALNIVNDIYYQVMDAASQQAEFNKTQSSCVTISVSPASPDSTFPKILSIDFGSVNCADNNNINHRGKLDAQLSNKPKAYNSSITVSLTDYYYNDMQITGMFTIKNRGLNKENHLIYYITVADLHISTNNQKNYIYYACSLKKEWILGADTPDIGDDAFYITGTSNGVNHVGNAYTTEIDSSLRFENTCKHFVSGSIRIYPDNLSMRKMDFGTGDCEGNITYNINGYSYQLVEN